MHVLTLLALLLWAFGATAHPLDYTRVTIALDPDGSWRRGACARA